MNLMEIPITSPLGYIGVLFLIAGVFLIITGLGILKVKNITVEPGNKTWALGSLIAILGVLFLLPEITKSTAITTTPSPTMVSTNQPGTIIGNLATTTTSIVSSTSVTPPENNSGLSTLMPQLSLTPTISTDELSEEFSDDFNNGFSEKWAQVQGEWIFSNRIPFLRSGDCGILVVGNPDLNNYAIDVDLLNIHDGGILFAYNEKEGVPNFSSIRFRREDDYPYLATYVLNLMDENGNSYSPADSYDTFLGIKNPGPPYHFHLEIVNQEIRLSINDQQVYDYSGLLQQLAGPVGLYTCAFEQTLNFDNFSISSLRP